MKSNSIILHVFRREIIDQWRDRRTLLTVIFLPLLLYPILGLGMLQMMQFMSEKPTRVVVVGSEHLVGGDADVVPLFVSDGWNKELVSEKDATLSKVEQLPFLDNEVSEAAQNLVHVESDSSPQHAEWRQKVQAELVAQSADVMLWITPTANVATKDTSGPAGSESSAPRLQFQLFQNSSSDQSRIAASRVEAILSTWYAANQKRARADELAAATGPAIDYTANDLAPREQIQSQLWARILPFILFLWTLTGAFYAAVDGCAGEKERGTLEALLVTPATRRQIVVGKLCTTMTFSLASGLVNLIGTIGTGLFVTSQLSSFNAPGLSQFGPPPLSALGWLLVGAIPISALFSAISLSVAAFARSSKEGQHYLLPILMASLPLLTLPLLPGVQMDLGLSLVPISGLMFWLRALIEGEYWNALRYTLPIFIVNGWCVYLAISWAVLQFQHETVLFRPVERFSLVAWLAAVFRRSEPWPSISQVVLLVGLIAGLKVFWQGVAPHPIDWPSFVAHTVIVLTGAVAVPAIVLAFTSTRAPLETLQLRRASFPMIFGAMAMAFCFHPLIVAFQQWVMTLYPLSVDAGQLQSVLNNILDGSPGMWAILLVMAVTPAVCEELAFRGFILSGLRRALKPVNAIFVTAVLFGAMHGLLQQSIVASATGVLLGFVAFRTGSLWPCIAYHATHNALTLQFAFFNPESIAQSKLLSFLLEAQVNEQQQLVSLGYAPLPAAFMIICGVWIAWSLNPGSNRKTSECVGHSLAGLKPSVSEASGL
ncbi:MAG: CPBP family intramembrane metalloprotease [Planctomycetaceae bacterium]|nr:CPBP family intramembrane metalloprotease [Planctomycetaceae bacterium]